ncbi:MAG: secondary thiamine-phosphate synthase enzyme YjbQ [Fidelibacterota bacterium]
MMSLSVSTRFRADFVDITSRVQQEVSASGVEEGMIVLYVPHTTCGITINESADPAVAEDIKGQLATLVPQGAAYRHREGNADSHIKTSMVGSSETVFIEKGQLVLGTWQGIFLADFDGPRTRKVYLKIVEA